MNQTSLTELSEILKSQLFAKFPEWQKCAEIVESDFNIEESSSLYFQIPSPVNKNCFLSILERGDCIEVSFSDGNSMGTSERQIICEKGVEIECVAAAIDFIEEIIDEKVVIGRECLSWLFGSKDAPSCFIETNELAKKRKKLVSISSWKGKYNWELEK